MNIFKATRYCGCRDGEMGALGLSLEGPLTGSKPWLTCLVFKYFRGRAVWGSGEVKDLESDNLSSMGSLLTSPSLSVLIC